MSQSSVRVTTSLETQEHSLCHQPCLGLCHFQVVLTVLCNIYLLLHCFYNYHVWRCFHPVAADFIYLFYFIIVSCVITSRYNSKKSADEPDGWYWLTTALTSLDAPSCFSRLEL